MRFDSIQVSWTVDPIPWTLNRDVTNYSCMVRIWGYNSYGIWTSTSLYRPFGGEPEHMGGALMNIIYPSLLDSNEIKPMDLKYKLESQFGFSGTAVSIDKCYFMYEIIPSYKSIKGWKIIPYYRIDKEVWEFKKEEEIDLKQYKKIKPIEFFE